MSRCIVLLMVAAAGTFLPRRAIAQLDPGRAVIAGTIRVQDDTTPVDGAEVYLVGSRERTKTNAHGQFRFSGIYKGRYEVRARKLGYEQLVKFVTVAGGETSTNDWSMRLLPQQLAEVRVMGRLVSVPSYLQDAYRRAATGFGDYILPDDIASRHAFNAIELLDGIPGVQVQTGGGLDISRCEQSAWRTPFPESNHIQVYIDGQRLTRTMPAVQVLDMVKPVDIAMIEVYRGVGRIPGEFLEDACAVVVIWTKHGT